jgi:hypothetical protein
VCVRYTGPRAGICIVFMFYSHRDSPRVEVPGTQYPTNFNYWGAYELLSQLIENRAKPLCKVTPRKHHGGLHSSNGYHLLHQPLSHFVTSHRIG